MQLQINKGCAVVFLALAEKNPHTPVYCFNSINDNHHQGNLHVQISLVYPCNIYYRHQHISPTLGDNQ
jgi:hypothetical protein